MRAAFDNVMNVYNNDGSGGPGTFRFTTACRFVVEHRIVDESPILDQVQGYVTYVGGILSAGTTTFLSGVIQQDTTDAWVVEFSSDPGTFYFVRYCQRISPRGGVPYRRAYLQAS